MGDGFADFYDGLPDGGRYRLQRSRLVLNVDGNPVDFHQRLQQHVRRIHNVSAREGPKLLALIKSKTMIVVVIITGSTTAATIIVLILDDHFSLVSLTVCTVAIDDGRSTAFAALVGFCRHCRRYFSSEYGF